MAGAAHRMLAQIILPGLPADAAHAIDSVDALGVGVGPFDQPTGHRRAEHVGVEVEHPVVPPAEREAQVDHPALVEGVAVLALHIGRDALDRELPAQLDRLGHLRSR